MYSIKFLDNKDRIQLVEIVKNRFKQIPESKDFCKPYLYRNLLLIKIFPAQVYVLIYEVKSIITKNLYVKRATVKKHGQPQFFTFRCIF